MYIHKMKNALKDSGKILHNRFVLYFVLLLALADLLYLAMGGEYISVAIFLLSGFVTSFFSKNMMVVMCIAMVITNILKYGTDIRMQEGLKEEGKKTTEKMTPTRVDEKANKMSTDGKVKTDDKTKQKNVMDNMTPEQVAKITENLEKLETYEPLFTSMDKLMLKINELIS